jgi:hypothetical protein
VYLSDLFVLQNIQCFKREEMYFNNQELLHHGFDELHAIILKQGAIWTFYRLGGSENINID